MKAEELLVAEFILGELNKDLAAEFEQRIGVEWPRNWMQKHVNDRATIIRARQILIERAEALQFSPTAPERKEVSDMPKNQLVFGWTGGTILQSEINAAAQRIFSELFAKNNVQGLTCQLVIDGKSTNVELGAPASAAL